MNSILCKTSLNWFLSPVSKSPARVSFLCEALLHPFPFPEFLLRDLLLHSYCTHLLQSVSTILGGLLLMEVMTTTALLTAVGLHHYPFITESP